MNVRKRSLDILLKIMLDNQYSNLVLRKELEGISSASDKALITNIVYGTLQNHRYLRYQYEPFIERSLYKDMMILLDLSVYQLMFLDKVPAYAIINDAVEIAKDVHRGKFANVINAILRNVVRQKVRPLPEDKYTSIAIKTSHPDWLVKMWVKQYGEEVCFKILEDNNKTPLNMARINRLATTEHELESLGFKHFEGECFTYNGNIASTSAYQEGLVSIQDYASMQVAPFLNPKAGEKVLDTCSAPGTKTCQMAELMENQGVIVAMDIHQHRVDLINHSARRLKLDNIQTLCKDATTLHLLYDKESFDKILVDAPCTGYGVMKRKADIKYHLKPEDMDEIVQIQGKILLSASRILKIGGELVYSTCTLNKKENELQIAKFLKANPNYELVAEQTLLPYEHQCDGFYMAKLKKIG